MRRITKITTLWTCILLLVSLAGCWGSTSGDDGDGPLVVGGGQCTVDAGEMHRCKGTTVQKCDGENWVDVEDCSAKGQECKVDGNGGATCSGGKQKKCETGETEGKCNPGSSCTEASGCASGVCGDNGLCLPSTCSNGMQDGDETGPDCGGSCPKCVGEPCSKDEHCITNYCKNRSCASPSCTDKVQNGTETGADCGGDCPPCPVGEECDTDSDCKTGRCDGGSCADLPATCNDNEKNGEETGVDCGGSQCGACPLEENCEENGDCLSKFCKYGVCKEATCDDEIVNQGESDEDCGGENCDPCPDGKKCEGNSDCQSGRCTAGNCTSCEDGVKNGNEVGVDCGGDCGACDDGSPCQRDGDCRGGKCKNGKCCTPNRCGFCGETPTETCNGKDDDCDGRTDEYLDRKAPKCNKQDGVCRGAEGECRGSQGWVCDTQTYKNHDSAYQTSGDKPCDKKDNDCDGKTDEDACPADNDPCTSEKCFAGSCSSVQGGNDGAPCGMSRSSNRDKMQYCDYRCDYFDDVCVCDSRGCTWYNYVPSGMYSGVHTKQVSSCNCAKAYSGARYKFTLYVDSGNTARERCYSSCHEHKDGNKTYYSCQ